MKRTTQSPEKLSHGLLDKVDALAAPHGLMAMGGLHTDPDLPPETLVLIGTAAHFWPEFKKSPEHEDGAPDPVDRWSQRLLPMIAQASGAAGVVYPFDGPPYAPFISWAKATREAFDSPTGMLVHVKAGLMISYRGALVFSGRIHLPADAPTNPCDTCQDRSCETACPVGALSPNHFYDVPVCKSFLATTAGRDCMSNGCATRLACPVSQRFNRPNAQTAHHMRAFKGF
ncbi:ferredoxin [Sulfitobacter sp. F26169L]|uniref:ferredoxin n=1 Tax=Sulfitobacter sp. F26169L TaxID=2996015 RepID=UPI002260A729|nr:ferredoxin [Sulfitobacter sp. F26169L]MCX7566849.1 ferredoxin [Sulfitobacter sp. F26169L]